VTTDKALIRAAGEHAVVSELSRRGALAALVAEGARGVDVLASKGSARVTIPVKTRRRRGGSWPVQNLSEDADFSVLVLLGEPNEYWIIPTRELMAVVREGHELWVRTPGRNGRPHNPNSPMMVGLPRWPRSSRATTTPGTCSGKRRSLLGKLFETISCLGKVCP
jgi:hypothetical protein